MFESIDTIFIQVSNFEKARSFYAYQVGLPEIHLEDEFIGFSIGDTTLVIEEVETTNMQKSKISVIVEDIHSVYQELIERGVSVKTDSHFITSQDILTFYDPDGNQWILVQE
ncbi:MAG: VOC family protein [bacterium]|nr:VOC family protein [bacterium]